MNITYFYHFLSVSKLYIQAVATHKDHNSLFATATRLDQEKK